MDTELFALAVEAALRIPSSGIGTLSEKKVHAALKYYVQPDNTKHEVKLSGYVSDALSEDGVFEIQTRGLYRLSKKLDTFLPLCKVTVIYPIISEKLLYITDSETGETTVRKSTKKMTRYDVLEELYGIRSFIKSQNLRLRLITISAEEHRIVRTRVSKKGRKKVETLSSETVPTLLHNDITFISPADYSQLLPDRLPDEFTSADFSSACKMHRSAASLALLVLNELEVVKRIGKIGNAYLYKAMRTDTPIEQD